MELLSQIAAAVFLTAPALAAQEIILKVEGADVLAQLGRGAAVGDLTGDGVPDFAHIENLGQMTGRLIFASGADGVAFDEIVSSDYSQGLVRVASLGDFNGDGAADVLMGDSIDAVTLNDDGVVKVISGATRAEIAVFPGPPNQASWFGWRIAGVGDVDQDGYADALAVGRFGSASLFFGPDGSRTRVHSTFGGALSVAGVGDVNADGHPDYAIGSPQFWAAGTELQVGALDIYSGIDGSLIRRVIGVDRDDHLGMSSAPAGDLDGDGYGDVLVGVPGTDDPSNSADDGGRVIISSGSDGSTLWEERVTTLPTSFGFGVFGGEDFTGDGNLDWGVFDTRTDGHGSIHLFDGASRQRLWQRYAESFGGFHALPAFFPGDMNGDGIADIAYGDATADPGDVSNAGVLWVLAGAPGYSSPYCDANLNSSGRRARISLDGPVSVGNNELALEVTGAALGTFGLFFYGTEPRQTLFGDGIRCVGGDTQRLFPPISIDDEGRAYRALDFTLPPVAPGGPSPIEPGDTRFFQFWFRDPGGAGGNGFNLSGGVEILFTP